jgi:hypothetical protein
VAGKPTGQAGDCNPLELYGTADLEPPSRPRHWLPRGRLEPDQSAGYFRGRSRLVAARPVWQTRGEIAAGIAGDGGQSGQGLAVVPAIDLKPGHAAHTDH